MSLTDRDTLLDIYRRERLSFLQYVRQATPYAGPADRPTLARVRELAGAELAATDRFGAYLDRNRITLPHVGAFPTSFTNYNFIAVGKLLAPLRQDAARGAAELERDAITLPLGEARTLVDELAVAKRMHISELEKLA
jgi:hypothetical protein